MWNELEKILTGWMGRRRLQRALRWALRGLPGGLALALGLSALLMAQHRLLVDEFVRLGLGCALLALVVGLAAGFFWPEKRLRAVQQIDYGLNLRERVITAYELRQSKQVAEFWRERQLGDALAAARGVDLAKQMPLTVERVPLLAAAGLVIALALLGWQGQSLFQAALQDRLVEQAIQQEAAKVEELIEQIENTQALTPAQREALTAPLEEALQKMQEAQTQEQAVSALNEAEQKMEAMGKPLDESEMEALQNAGEKLSAENSEQLKDLSEAMQEGDLGKTAEELQNLDPSEMSAEEQQALAEQLEQTAQELQESNPGMAQAMQDAAQALQQGDAQSAKQALEQAGQSMEQAQLDEITAEEAEKAAQQLKEMQDQVAQSGGQGQQGQQGQGQNGQQGQSQNQNGQQGQGQKGSQQDPTKGEQSGGGAGRGNQTEGLPPGEEAPFEEIDQNNGAGDGGKRDYEEIYAPERLGGEHDQGLGAPQSGQPGDQTIGEQNSATGGDSPSQVPYVDVLPEYGDAYRKAIESGQIPPHLRPLIRKYFSSLEP